MNVIEVITSPLVWGPIAGVIVLIALGGVFFRNYIKVPPNQVAVFTGRGTPKTVRGGARLRIPGFERVDTMSLEPFNIEFSLKGALSDGGVPVDINAVGQVRFGAEETMLQTAIQRYLTTDRKLLHAQLNEILSGSMRGIVARMTVEALNSDREGLIRGVIEEAGSTLEKIGIEVDTLVIQTITDQTGYMEALGAKRTAEVKRDAAIGQAEANRDTKIKSAEAQRLGDIAEAEATAAIAEANRDRDIRLAQAQARVQAEQANAAQAGPLAEAQARKAVGVAEQQAEEARVQARVAVEQRRAEEAQMSLQADVIAPAEAQKAAAIAEAEGRRQAAILQAQADAEAVRQRGQAEADARKLAAQATQAEGEAEAAATLAKLKADAEGQTDRATALNSFSAQAMQLEMIPLYLRAQVDSVAAASEPLGNIDRVSIFGTSGDGNGKGGLFGSLTDNAPRLIAGVSEVLADQGVDVGALLSNGGLLGGLLKGSGTVPQTPSTATEAPATAPKKRETVATDTQ